jgi:hypothetical protein
MVFRHTPPGDWPEVTPPGYLPYCRRARWPARAAMVPVTKSRISGPAAERGQPGH